MRITPLFLFAVIFCSSFVVAMDSEKMPKDYDKAIRILWESSLLFLMQNKTNARLFKAFDKKFEDLRKGVNKSSNTHSSEEIKNLINQRYYETINQNIGSHLKDLIDSEIFEWFKKVIYEIFSEDEKVDDKDKKESIKDLLNNFTKNVYSAVQKNTEYREKQKEHNGDLEKLIIDLQKNKASEYYVEGVINNMIFNYHECYGKGVENKFQNQINKLTWQNNNLTKQNKMLSKISENLNKRVIALEGLLLKNNPELKQQISQALKPEK